MAEETNSTNPNINPDGGAQGSSDGGNSEWYAGIDQNLVTDKIKGFKDLGAFVKSYNESQSFIGKGIPDDNTPDDIRNAFYAKLGRPESADKYDWQPPEGLSVEGATAENFKAFKEKCFEAGMTNKQVSTVMGGWSEIVATIMANEQNARAEIAKGSKETLSAPNEWGDKYDDKLQMVLKRIDDLGVRRQLEAAGVLYDTKVLKAFDSVISEARETTIRGADGKEISPVERIAQLKASPAYLNPSNPDHDAVVRELNSLVDSQ
jgi:hypothetical protein|nr:MAG TPA: hypothetical protein [Caudoviricetes sp.]